jgi:hypothetical protein
VLPPPPRGLVVSPPPRAAAAAALGWGVGIGLGTQYIDVSPEFAESRSHRPNVFKQLQYALKRVATLNRPPPPGQAPAAGGAR